MLKTLYLFNRLTGISTGQEDEIMLKKDKSEALTKEYNKYYPGGHSNLPHPLAKTTDLNQSPYHYFQYTLQPF